jgi:hypothetical protein
MRASKDAVGHDNRLDSVRLEELENGLKDQSVRSCVLIGRVPTFQGINFCSLGYGYTNDDFACSLVSGAVEDDRRDRKPARTLARLLSEAIEEPRLAERHWRGL